MKKWIVKLKNPTLVAGGTLVLSFSTAVFILPFNLVVGGMSGIAICLNRLVAVDRISTDGWITLLTWGLFFLGWALFGKKFAAKTLLSALLYPAGIALFSRLAEAMPAIQSPLLSSIFGGLLIGIGCALTFLGGGSSGGVDVLALALCRAHPRLRHATALLLLDAVTLLLGAVVLRNLALTLLGMLSAFTASIAVDFIMQKKYAPRQ